ncbi:MAG TPA: hypothetical protein DEF39_10370 [Hungateiclostridium thermocellum]|jgi:hypothetical protein|uniref:Uncharacterized protein n=1 Tax=Acetivibrio thermocellus AD2 TaxID=1138384 RepID=A0AB36TLM5_ACETH|nr:hypothetical protein [Acetivibrio thermocellus]CDG36790.1 putative membrane protein [Acetivibrio thermocellus BC1]ADU75928.1 hypothetical protein Clo1313_2949 [Acetivibrio thermocellus DSM 1313]ALX09961.1 hypothetical protein AD2_02983 [Acetivibrio thermocellus AD2]ANV77735.1 hypothetical protein LQRI_2994 [Acetivibrio thermocellus DSM 2360]EIC03842.1 hypothetical protein YSBL_2483 [Acetivibrio thermocellus YS]
MSSEGWALKKFFQAVLILEIVCLLVEIIAAIESPLFWIFAIMIGIFVLVLLRMVWRCEWKIEQLRREK